MEEARTLAIVIGNLGGVGALAWALLALHKDSLRAFREELAKERACWQAAREADRLERLAALADHRSEVTAGQRELRDHLDRIEEWVSGRGRPGRSDRNDRPKT